MTVPQLTQTLIGIRMTSDFTLAAAQIEHSLKFRDSFIRYLKATLGDDYAARIAPPADPKDLFLPGAPPEPKYWEAVLDTEMRSQVNLKLATFENSAGETLRLAMVPEPSDASCVPPADCTPDDICWESGRTHCLSWLDAHGSWSRDELWSCREFVDILKSDYPEYGNMLPAVESALRNLSICVVFKYYTQAPITGTSAT